jgi:hypothetical protein
MPGFITHYICGQAVLRAAPLAIQKMVEPHAQIFNLGTQGPDIFFYYFPGMLKKRIRQIGRHMHEHSYGLFLGSMAALLRGAETQDTHGILLAYICGNMTHYALDVAAHPYVYAKVGTPQKGKKMRTIKNSVNHRRLETAIDVLMLNLMSSEKPADYKLWQLIRVESDPAHTVAERISECIQETYDIPVSPRDVYKAMMYMIRVTRVIQSRNGRRKRFMELIENLTIGEHLFSSIVHMQEVTDGVDYMNMEKSPWMSPNIEEEKTDSFLELYHEAVEDAVQMMETLWRYIQGEVSQSKLAAVLGDRSLHTGQAVVPAFRQEQETAGQLF